jgi:hypothetical protein
MLIKTMSHRRWRRRDSETFRKKRRYPVKKVARRILNSWKAVSIKLRINRREVESRPGQDRVLIIKT